MRKIFILLFLLNNCLFSGEGDDKSYNIELKKVAFVGYKNTVSFARFVEATLIVKDFSDDSIKYSDENVSSKFEAKYSFEIMELNEETEYTKVKVVFSKARRIERGIEQNMYFALNKPYYFITDKNETKCFLDDKEILNEEILVYVKCMPVSFFSSSSTIVRNVKVGEVKILNSLEKNDSDLNDGEMSVEKEQITLVGINGRGSDNEGVFNTKETYFSRSGKKDSNAVKSYYFEKNQTKEEIIGVETKRLYSSVLSVEKKEFFEGVFARYLPIRPVAGFKIMRHVFTTKFEN